MTRLAAILLLCCFAASSRPMPPVMPSVVVPLLSPKAASLVIKVVPQAIVAPPQAIVFSVSNTNWFEVQARRIATSDSWKALTNGYGALAVTFATLNLLTNPIVGFANTLQWNPTTDPVVAGTDLLDWQTGAVTNWTNAGGNTNFTVLSPTRGKTFYAAVHYSAAGVLSPLSNIVTATNRIVQPPVALLFRAKQTNGVAPVLNWKVVDL